MRELRFRVWDKKEEKYLSNEDTDPHIDYEGNLCLEHVDCEGSFHPMVEEPARYIVEFYMGLKDKNGKEIYEGDIVKTEWATGQIIYEGDSFNIYLGVARALPDGSCRNFIEYKDNWQSWEVIGNIYENPELTQ